MHFGGGGRNEILKEGGCLPRVGIALSYLGMHPCHESSACHLVMHITVPTVTYKDKAQQTDRF
jgi:hypothetical protein